MAIDVIGQSLLGARPCRDTRSGIASCFVRVAFRPTRRNRLVCLEAEPWSGPITPGLEFYMPNTDGTFTRVTIQPDNVPVFVCHTSREGHRQLSTSGFMGTLEEYYQTKTWKDNAEKAKSLAHNRCDICGEFSLLLEAHHPSYDRLGKERPEEIQVLCSDCHARQPR